MDKPGCVAGWSFQEPLRSGEIRPPNANMVYTGGRRGAAARAGLQRRASLFWPLLVNR